MARSNEPCPFTDGPEPARRYGEPCPYCLNPHTSPDYGAVDWADERGERIDNDRTPLYCERCNHAWWGRFPGEQRKETNDGD